MVEGLRLKVHTPEGEIGIAWLDWSAGIEV
jgi:hypothetical protein